MTSFENCSRGRVREEPANANSDGRHSWNMFQINNVEHEAKLNESNISDSTNYSAREEDECEEYGSSDRLDAADTSRKKKTPMCLINELARHHKFQPQYRLTEESGPAHAKTFIVNLKLGEEEYAASGQSIKKAQHAAAQLALQNTTFQQPDPKPKLRNPQALPANQPVTPTVELNALTMKLNLSPLYTALPSTSLNNQKFSGDVGTTSSLGVDIPPRLPGPDYQKNSSRLSPRFPIYPNQRFFYNRLPANPMTHHVSLTVGQISVSGEGPTPQAARHHAASQALQQLKSDSSSATNTSIEDTSSILDGSMNTQLKSPVSLVHELALKLNLTVEFPVVSESGPPHMKNFVVECKLGEYTTSGDGNCKKLAKKKASEMMLEEMKKIHPNGIAKVGDETTHFTRLRPKQKSLAPRRKPRNLVKEVTSATNSQIGSKAQDPISHLVQHQQSLKEKEPVFTVVSETGIPRQPEFIVQVAVGSLTANGTGSKKKFAKRAAAKKALELLGVKDKEPHDRNEDKPCTVEAAVSASQLDSSLPHSPAREQIPGLLVFRAREPVLIKGNTNAENSLVGENKESSLPSNSTQSKVSCVGSETRLRYLAKIMNYEVDFSDFPKGNDGEILSLVTLYTTPTSVCHAVGSTHQEAHDNAAASILKLIADGGINMTTKETASNSEETVKV